MVIKPKRKSLTFSRKDLICEPYRICPNCGHKSFGLVFSVGGGQSFSRECLNCWHGENYKLPEIKKKVIYLDQFAISNMMKALNPEHPSHQKINLEQPFWLEIYKKLDVLSKLELIICPDSHHHRHESVVMGNNFEVMELIYEHFSGGNTFYDHHTISRFQIIEHFRNYLDGHSEITPVFQVDDIIHGSGSIHEWRGNMRVSVRHRPKKEEIEGLLKNRDETYKLFLPIFERWREEGGKTFKDFMIEETRGFGKDVWQVFTKHAKRQAELPEKYLKTGKLDLEDVFPPQTNDLLNDMFSEVTKREITGEEALNKMNEYFNSEDILIVPSMKIHSMLLASIARQATLGRVHPPSKGIFTDIEAISDFLPFCDAMFIDNENANLLTTNPIKKELNFPTLIFSVKTKDRFMEYLDSIQNNASPEHIKLVKDMHSDSWPTPYLSILTDRNKKIEDFENED